MSNTARPDVRNSVEPPADPRVARTHAAIGRAVAELIAEGDINAVPVQAILDRAGVARATFYAHYRGKDDALFAAFERLFAWLDERIDAEPPGSRRLYPLRELLEHARDATPVLEGLHRAGLLPDLWSMLGEHASRIIARRLPAGAAGDARALQARMLAGAVVECVRWWEPRRDTVSPAAVDEAFHSLRPG